MKKRKRILLINPWIYDLAAFDFWMKPLGLLSLAALFRCNGYQVDYLDCLIKPEPGTLSPVKAKALRRTEWGTGHFVKESIPKPSPLKDFPRKYYRYGITPQIFVHKIEHLPKPDLILITCMMTYWYPGVFEAIRIIKEILPDVRIVLGGNYVSLCPDHARLSGAAMILTGPGEQQTVRILKTFFNEDPSFLPNFEDLDSYPLPAFDLLPQHDQIPLLTSRGCPYRCTYCAAHILQPQFRRRDPCRVAEEISFWHHRFGVRHFSFYDDALLVDPQSMAIPLLKKIISREEEIFFHCPNGLHLRAVSAELARLMFLAGFKTIRFGFETADHTRQADTGGKVSNEEFVAALHYLKEAGYRSSDIGIYLLCGLPGQSAEEVEKSILFVKSQGAKPIIAEYSPIPGTGLWESSLKSTPLDLLHEPLYQNNSLLPCRSDFLTYRDYQRLKSMTRSSVQS